MGAEPGSNQPDLATIAVSRRGGAVWIELNRPDQLNALSRQMIAEIGAVLDGLGPDDRCLVIAGRGRAFSAGGDLVETRLLFDGGAGVDEVGTFYASIDDLLRRVESLAIPVIAAVDGFAIAGGLELSMCCDLVVASDRSQFGDGHSSYGLVPGGGGCSRLPRRIGLARAKDLAFTGRRVTAATMQLWGLVSVVVPPDEVESATEDLVESLVARSADGLRAMKAVLDSSVSLSLEESLDLERELCREHLLSPDYAEGLAAFAEGRTPRFG